MIEMYFVDTMTRIRRTTDSYGRKTDASTTTPCRWERTENLRVSIDGKDQFGTFRIFVPAGFDIKRGDYIFEGVGGTGNTPKEFVVISVMRARGFETSHQEVVV
jgi:hypothetical protein